MKKKSSLTAIAILIFAMSAIAQETGTFPSAVLSLQLRTKTTIRTQF